MLLLAGSFTSSLLVASVLALAALLTGFAGGWWFFAPTKDEREAAARRSDQAMMAIGRIHDLASRVAQDVDVHTSEVDKISAELQSLNNSESSAGGSSASATIAKVLSANERLKAQLAAAEEKLQAQAAEIATHQSAAQTDALTGLPNRRAFDQEVARRYSEWQRKGTPFTLVLADVDQFKRFNDQHGHQAGDEVLRQIGRKLSSVMREMDLACRYGGEEFVAVMPATQLADAAKAAERARRMIEELAINWEGKRLNITACFGLAQVRPNEDAASVLRRADEALYASKAAGRNCGFLHDGKECIRLSGGSPAPPAFPVEPAKRTPQLLFALPDRRQVDLELSRRIAESEKYGLPLSVMDVRLDQYARIKSGHADEDVQLVLDAVARGLQSTIREMDFLARDADGRFIIILPGSSAVEATQVARRIQTTQAAQSVQVGATTMDVALALGLASYRQGDGVESLFRRAERSLAEGELAAEERLQPLTV
jgi:diguanylate cyclase